MEKNISNTGTAIYTKNHSKPRGEKKYKERTQWNETETQYNHQKNKTPILEILIIHWENIRRLLDFGPELLQQSDTCKNRCKDIIFFSYTRIMRIQKRKKLSVIFFLTEVRLIIECLIQKLSNIYINDTLYTRHSIPMRSKSNFIIFIK